MTTESRELSIWIINDGNLYRQQTTPIIVYLKKKIKKGTYDPQKALILWKHLADSGAKSYVKEFGGVWHEMFSVADRKETAKELAEYYMEHLQENPKRKNIFGRKAHSFREKPHSVSRLRAARKKMRTTRVKRNPPPIKKQRASTNDDLWSAIRGLGMFSKSVDRLIALYNEHKDNPNFASKVIAEAAKQVAITKGAKVKRK